MDDDSFGTSSRLAVEGLLTRLFVSMDEGRWEDVADCLSERVLLDLSSEGGGRATRTTRKKVVEALEGRLRGLASVQHQVGNVLIEVGEDGASAFCYCTESDYFPNETGGSVLTKLGSYDFHLSLDAEGAWKFDALRFNLKFSHGNPLLAELARKASRKGQRGADEG